MNSEKTLVQVGANYVSAKTAQVASNIESDYLSFVSFRQPKNAQIISATLYYVQEEKVIQVVDVTKNAQLYWCLLGEGSKIDLSVEKFLSKIKIDVDEKVEEYFVEIHYKDRLKHSKYRVVCSNSDNLQFPFSKRSLRKKNTIAQVTVKFENGTSKNCLQLFQEYLGPKKDFFFENYIVPKSVAIFIAEKFFREKISHLEFVGDVKNIQYTC